MDIKYEDLDLDTAYSPSDYQNPEISVWMKDNGKCVINTLDWTCIKYYVMEFDGDFDDEDSILVPSDSVCTIYPPDIERIQSELRQRGVI